jgi:tetratricopeptide (TPR) repeat protein
MNSKAKWRKLFHLDFSNKTNYMKFKYYMSLCFFYFVFFGFSQEALLKKANSNYQNFHYIDAIKIYEKVANKGYKSIDLFSKLGDSYYFQSKLKEANQWYVVLFSLKKSLDSEYYFRYAQTLKAVGEYQKADAMMTLFNQLNSEDLRGKLSLKQLDYLDEIKRNSGRFTVENAGINSEFSDYGATLYNNKLVFTSARDTGGVFVKKHSWTNQSFTNLYSSLIAENGTLSIPEKFPNEVNSKYHESTPVFTNNGNTMYFTRNNYINGKKGKDKDKVILLKLYSATKTGDKWGAVTELPFNSNEYSCAHPTLSTDEKTLYFSSNMPGTRGMSDIYKVAILSDGNFGKPINLGDKINTEARESFPFISTKNELYFASDGHPGLGGLDVFFTQLNEDGTHGKIKNIGAPVNSNLDDFAFIINTESKNGYFSSNREVDNLGHDDIYKCTERIPLPAENQKLHGFLLDSISQLPIEGMKITLFDLNYKKIDEITSDKDGKFDFGKVDYGTTFRILPEGQNYFTKEKIIKINDEFDREELKFYIEPTLRSIKVGSDLLNLLGIKLIYFDLDKAIIRKEAEVELAKIVEVMKQNPTMEIDVRSHTDSRQTTNYNLVLSDKRVKSTIKWLVANGIEAHRLTGRGYGESQLVNKCTEDIPCTEEEHQANRRSEFIVMKL